MMKQSHIAKIKAKGYWRVHFRPLVAKIKLDPIGKCRGIIEKNSIDFTGWDYPHIPKREDENTSIDVGENYYQGWLEWDEYGHNEFWRMYQSGQFIHYFGLIEDWVPLKYQNIWERTDRKPQSGDALGISRTIYFITSIYQFLSRLIQDGLYDEGIAVSISLNNTQGRELVVDHHSRFPLSYPRKSNIPKIEFTKMYSKADVLNKTKEITIATIVFFFERFKWDPPNIEMIKVDYENLLNGKV